MIDGILVQNPLHFNFISDLFETFERILVVSPFYILTHSMELPLAKEISLAFTWWYERLKHGLELPLAREIRVALNWWYIC